LGGTTVIGRGSIIGGSVVLTMSVPAGSRVAMERAKLVIGGNGADSSMGDFDI